MRERRRVVAPQQAEVERVDRLPHLGGEHVADGARALARLGDAARDRGRVAAVEREPLRRPRRASTAGRARSAPMIASSASHDSRTPGVVAAALDVGVEDAVEHARGVLGARELAADPVELVGDPGEHQPCCCCCCWPDHSPPWRRPGSSGGDQPRDGGDVRASCRSLLLEHPRVLRAAALGGVDDHRALAQRDAREPAGDDVDVLAEHGERAQVDVARRRARRPATRSGRSTAAPAPARSSAPGRRWISSAWRATSSSLALGPMNTPLPPDWSTGLTTSWSSRPSTSRALLGVGQQVGRDVGQDRLLAEVEADHLRHVVVDGLVVGDAGPDRVDDRHGAGAVGAHQPGDAEQRVRPELQRVHEVVVDPAVDRVDALQAVGGADVAGGVAHDEVGRLDQLDAHLAREERVLEVGRVERARRPDDDGRPPPPRSSAPPR